MPMYKKSMLVLLVIIAAAIGGTMYGYFSQEQQDKISNAAEKMENTKQMAVFVTGAVNKPGVVNLPQGSRLQEAITACEGLTPMADLDRINMAMELKDGTRITVPEKKQAGSNNGLDANKASANSSALKSKKEKSSKIRGNASTNGNNADTSVDNYEDGTGKININTATLEELDSLPGVGPAMAQRIIDYRESRGGFKSIDELKKVKGIGTAKYNNLKNMITI